MWTRISLSTPDNQRLSNLMRPSLKEFQKTVWTYYKKAGRHDLPWRLTFDPYHIAVSEVMLQQTQVGRVVPKYEAFLKRWGSARALARAPLKDVLTAWQGLGYNRRAKMLHECAKAIVTEHSGKFPDTYKELVSLPGIGPYTAGAILAFAFNKPHPIIETNIRTVYLHHFYKDATDVPDSELLELVEKSLDQKRPREWYWALMDYGAHLKREYGNQNHRSQSYVNQSTFKGSDREIRGAILRTLTQTACTRSALHRMLTQHDALRIDAQTERLLGEGLIEKRGRTLQLPS